MIDGLIISNTTVTRPESLKSSKKDESGGLSGETLKEMSTNAIKEMYQLTKGWLVQGLPPLSKGEFEARAAVFQASNKEKEKVTLKCDSCNKHFSSHNAMDNHLKSKKHLDCVASAKTKAAKPVKEIKLSETSKTIAEAENKDDEIVDEDASDGEWSDADSDWESCDEEDENVKRVVVNTDDCLFCYHHSDSTENNVKNMTEVHSFFIPDVEYVSDLDGLIAFLAGKIHIGHMRLWCDGKGKGFRSVKSVKQHMIDKGH